MNGLKTPYGSKDHMQVGNMENKYGRAQ